MVQLTKKKLHMAMCTFNKSSVNCSTDFCFELLNASREDNDKYGVERLRNAGALHTMSENASWQNQSM